MRKAVIVTSSATTEQIKKFDGQKIIALPNAVSSFEQLTIKYEVLNSGEAHKLEAVDATLDQPEIRLNEEQLLEIALDYLVSRGFDEITILKDIHRNLSLLIQALSSFNKFKDLQMEFVDEHESITFFSEGTYVLSKNNCKIFSLLTLNEAIISLDHVNRKLKSMNLKENDNIVSDLSFLQRVAVLKVEKGSVIMIRELENYD